MSPTQSVLKPVPGTVLARVPKVYVEEVGRRRINPCINKITK